jgi:serine phosphatase RsbU (regulator of sigma subunit)/PAS domain-containing protein
MVPKRWGWRGAARADTPQIDLAVGALAARLGCGREQAVAQLERLAKTYRVDLVEAASAVLATAGPAADGPSPAPPGPARPDLEARRFVDLPQTHADEAGWVSEAQAILDILPGAVAVNVPVRDAQGRIVDYRVVAASPEAVDIGGRRGRNLIGISTAQAYPALVGSELWRAYEQVLKTGRPRVVGPFTYAEVAEGIEAEALYTARLHRFGRGLLISWVRHDEERRYAVRLAQTERLGNLGWAEWDLQTNTIYWSEGMFEVYERALTSGPARLEVVSRAVHPDDIERVGEAIVAMLDNAQPMDLTYRILVGGRLKHVRSIFETSRDGKGRALKVYGITQDVTAVAAAERDRIRLADIEAELAERQRSLQTEHRLVAALQQVILPLPAGTIALPGLRVAVRYQPAEELTRVGGDWYDVVRLPRGRTLLAVGDVTGHGIRAAATMVRLRHTLAALAVTTSNPAKLLNLLNQLVRDDLAEPTATVVVATYDPATSSVTWAQAGHPPPVVLSGGAARALERPAGMLVGARPHTRYANARVILRPGDTMLLYTDGLVERRGQFETDWLAPVIEAVDGGGAVGLDELLERLQPANPDDDTCILGLRSDHR